MHKVKMQDGGTKYADSRKHRVGSWHENRQYGTQCIITSVEAGEVQGEYGIDKVWLHTMREATAEEISTREARRAEWAALSTEERTAERLKQIKKRVPGLDWG